MRGLPGRMIVLPVLLSLLGGAAAGATLAPAPPPGVMPPVVPSSPLAPGRGPSEFAQGGSPASRAGSPRVMRVLVISADGREPAFAAALAALDQLGVPADSFVARRDGRLTMDRLVRGTVARYYAVILATSTLTYPEGGRYISAFTGEEWRTLATFESQYRIRQVTMYTYPAPEYGFHPPSQAGEAVKLATLTPAGQRVFPYLNPHAAIPIRGAWTYLAAPLPGTVPLLVTPDGAALAALVTYPDGRENLVFTMDQNPDLLHTRLLAAGAVAWVTRGLYLGERRVYLTPQVDDLFFDDDRYLGPPYRITADDFRKVVAWQDALRRRPLTHGFRLAFAFNGEGTGDSGEDGEFSDDPLTNAAQVSQRQFEWINHTYGHTNLDATTERETLWELRRNDEVARHLGFTLYTRETLVTPDISGLRNPAAMAAAAAFGVRFVISDWSYPSGRNPRFNTGIRNALQPRILEIPRYPTNVFYNTTTPDELLAEFRALHPDFCRLFPSYCPLTYRSFLDFESATLLGRLFTYDIDPLMFHQSNLREYQSGHTLLGDLLVTVIAQYEALAVLPIRTLSMEQIGRQMELRAAYDAAGVVGVLVPGQSVTLEATSGAARMPVTGLRYGRDVDVYGPEVTSYITLSRGARVTLPLLPAGGEATR
jgi:peptidoglycan/xylan/chitin deacetylase (PgdA/CDA1 family)